MIRAALYARVSTAEGQTVETQLVPLREFAARAGWTATEHTDTASGASARRPSLDHVRALVKARALDVLAITRIDRLARSLPNFLDLVRELEHYGAALVVTEQGIDFTSPTGRLQAQILGAVAEFERELIRARTREGIHRARLDGIRIGRPRVEIPEAELRARFAAGESLGSIARAYNTTCTTVKKRVVEMGLSRSELRAPSAPS